MKTDSSLYPPEVSIALAITTRSGRVSRTMGRNPDSMICR